MCGIFICGYLVNTEDMLNKNNGKGKITTDGIEYIIEFFPESI